MRGTLLRLLGAGLLVGFLQACGGSDPAETEFPVADDASADGAKDGRGDERTDGAAGRDGQGNPGDASRDGVAVDAVTQGEGNADTNPTPDVSSEADADAGDDATGDLDSAGDQSADVEADQDAKSDAA